MPHDVSPASLGGHGHSLTRAEFYIYVLELFYCAVAWLSEQGLGAGACAC